MLLVPTISYATPVDDAQNNLNVLVQELSTISTDISKVQDELDVLSQKQIDKEKEIKDNEAKLKELREKLSISMAEQYKTGKPNLLSVLLNVSSFEEFANTIHLMDVVNENRADLIDETKELSDKLDNEKKELEKAKEDTEKKLTVLQAQSTRYQEKIESARQQFNQLSQEAQQQLISHANSSESRVYNSIKPVSYEVPKDISDSLKTVYAQIGKPYVWGATGPNSFDCSGLVCYAYGYKNGRTTSNMIATFKSQGKWKTSLSQLNIGDLVFPSYGHVGIYIGNGQMIHAPQPGESVKIGPVYAFVGGASY